MNPNYVNHLCSACKARDSEIVELHKVLESVKRDNKTLRRQAAVEKLDLQEKYEERLREELDRLDAELQLVLLNTSEKISFFQAERDNALEKVAEAEKKAARLSAELELRDKKLNRAISDKAEREDISNVTKNKKSIVSMIQDKFASELDGTEYQSERPECTCAMETVPTYTNNENSQLPAQEVLLQTTHEASEKIAAAEAQRDHALKNLGVFESRLKLLVEKIALEKGAESDCEGLQHKLTIEELEYEMKELQNSLHQEHSTKKGYQRDDDKEGETAHLPTTESATNEIESCGKKGECDCEVPVEVVNSDVTAQHAAAAAAACATDEQIKNGTAGQMELEEAENMKNGDCEREESAVECYLKQQLNVALQERDRLARVANISRTALEEHTCMLEEMKCSTIELQQTLSNATMKVTTAMTNHAKADWKAAAVSGSVEKLSHETKERQNRASTSESNGPVYTTTNTTQTAWNEQQQIVEEWMCNESQLTTALSELQHCCDDIGQRIYNCCEELQCVTEKAAQENSNQKQFREDRPKVEGEQNRSKNHKLFEEMRHDHGNQQEESYLVRIQTLERQKEGFEQESLAAIERADQAIAEHELTKQEVAALKESIKEQRVYIEELERQKEDIVREEHTEMEKVVEEEDCCFREELFMEKSIQNVEDAVSDIEKSSSNGAEQKQNRLHFIEKNTTVTAQQQQQQKSTSTSKMTTMTASNNARNDSTTIIQDEDQDKSKTTSHKRKKHEGKKQNNNNNNTKETIQYDTTTPLSSSSRKRKRDSSGSSTVDDDSSSLDCRKARDYRKESHHLLHRQEQEGEAGGEEERERERGRKRARERERETKEKFEYAQSNKLAREEDERTHGPGENVVKGEYDHINGRPNSTKKYIEDLCAKIEELERQKGDLKQKLSVVSEEATTARTEHSRIKEELVALEHKMNKKQQNAQESLRVEMKRAAELETERSFMKAQPTSTQETTENNSIRIKQLSIRNRDLEQRVSLATEQMSATQAELDRVRMDLASMEKSKEKNLAKIAELKIQNNNLEQKASLAADNASAMELDLDCVRTELVSLKKVTQKNLAQIKELSNLNKLLEQSASLDAETIAATEAELSSARAELITMEKSKEKYLVQIEEMNMQNNGLEQRACYTTDRLTVAEAELDGIRAELATMEKKTENKMTLIKELSTHKKDLEHRASLTTNNAVAAVEVKRDEARKALIEKEKQAESHLIDSNKLRSQIQDVEKNAYAATERANKVVAERNFSRGEVNALKDTIRELNKQIDELKRQQQDLEQKLSVTAEEEQGRLLDNLATMESRVLAERHDTWKIVSAARERAAVAVAEENRVRTELTAVQKATKQNLERIEELSLQNKELARKAYLATDKVTATEAELNSVRAELTSMGKRTEKKLAHIEELHLLNNDLEKRASVASAALAKVDKMAAERDLFREEVRTLKATIQELQRKKRELKRQQEGVEQKLSVALKAAALAGRENGHIRENLATMETEMLAERCDTDNIMAAARGGAALAEAKEDRTKAELVSMQNMRGKNLVRIEEMELQNKEVENRASLATDKVAATEVGPNTLKTELASTEKRTGKKLANKCSSDVCSRREEIETNKFPSLSYILYVLCIFISGVIFTIS